MIRWSLHWRCRGRGDHADGLFKALDCGLGNWYWRHEETQSSTVGLPASLARKAWRFPGTRLLYFCKFWIIFYDFENCSLYPNEDCVNPVASYRYMAILTILILPINEFQVSCYFSFIIPIKFLSLVFHDFTCKDLAIILLPWQNAVLV